MGKTLYEKVFDRHAVRKLPSGQYQLFMGLHLIHEVTSPQAFEGLELAGRKPWRIGANLAVSDHNVPTTDRSQGIADPGSKLAKAESLGVTVVDEAGLRALLDKPAGTS